MAQLELPIDHEPHLEYVAHQLAKELQEVHGYRSYDHAYESAWTLLEYNLEQEMKDESV